MQISRSELSNRKMIAGNEKKYSRVIINGVIKNWVGFGWVDEGKATAEDFKKYPTTAKETQ